VVSSNKQWCYCEIKVLTALTGDYIYLVVMVCSILQVLNYPLKSIPLRRQATLSAKYWQVSTTVHTFTSQMAVVLSVLLKLKPDYSDCVK